MNHLFYMSTSQIVGLQPIAGDGAQSGLMRLNQTGYNDVGRYVTDAHQEELHQRDVHARDLGAEPEEEGHIMEEHSQKHDATYDDGS